MIAGTTSIRRRKAFALAVALLAGAWGGLAPALSQQATAPEPSRMYHVGFSQIVDHPALNETRRGLIDGLAKAGFVEGKNLVFEIQIAQGDVANARNIAEKFLADKVDLMAVCTTPNTQAAMKVTQGSSVPVVFGCVTNPVEAGILKSLDQPTGTNVTGIFGIPPVAQMFEIMLQIKPDVKSIGTLYNSGESNSNVINRLAKAEAERRGLTWNEVQVASSAEVKNAVDSLVSKVDTLLTGQDNMVSSAFDALLKTARDNKIALFSLDTATVERGAIASYAQDQYQTGIDWANDIAVPVLLGRDPGTMVPARYRRWTLYVNTAAAAAMGVTVPPSLLAQAGKVFDK
jgi:putative tryptophan/tyrosine transport system substrate-binding protein